MSGEVLPAPSSNGSDQAREERMVGRAVLWALDKSKKNWKMVILALMILSGHPYARTLAESWGFRLPWSNPPVKVQVEAPMPGESWKGKVDRNLVELKIGQKDTNKKLDKLIELLKD